MEYQSLGSGYHIIRKGGYGYFSTGATDHELSHLLGIKIQKDITGNETGLKTVGSNQTLFLIYSKQALDRTMNKILVEQHSHSCCATHTVVGA